MSASAGANSTSNPLSLARDAFRVRRALRESRGENPVGARDLGGAGLLPVSALGPVSAILLMMPVTVCLGSFSVLPISAPVPVSASGEPLPVR
jgi:hypothetical protein